MGSAVRRIAYSLALLIIALLVGSRLYPEIKRVEVLGNERLSEEEILELARLAEGDPLLWVNAWTVRGLSTSPWIRQARVTRHLLERTIAVTIWERTPVATDGATVWAKDGTIMFGVPPEEAQRLVQIRGWGEPRIEEALDLLLLLADHEPKVVSYTPEGFEIQFAGGVLVTPQAQDLKNHWSAFVSHRGRRVAVYPWGVSFGND